MRIVNKLSLKYVEEEKIRTLKFPHKLTLMHLNSF
jgi:hypothetical protein